MGRVLPRATILALGALLLDGCGSNSTTSSTNAAAPTLSSITATPNPVDKGHNIVLSASASGGSGDTLTYDWTVPSGWTIVSGQGTSQLTVTAPNSYDSPASLSLQVSGNGGSVNGEITVSTIADPLPTISSVSASPNRVAPSTQQTLTASAFAGANDALTYNWVLTGGWTLVSGQGTASVTVLAPGTYAASGGATVTVSNPNGGSVTGQLGLGTTGDPLPTISSIAASSSPVNKGGVVILTAAASGAPGDTLTYAWTLPAGWTINSGQGTSQLTVTAPNAYSQTGSFTLTVGNGNGGSVNGQITVNTASDTVPTLTGITPSGNPVGKAATFTLSASASGAPGDTLGYTWGVPAGWTINSGQGTSLLSVTAPGLYNASGNFTLAVDNGSGGSVNGQITMTTSSDPPPALNSLVASANPVMRGGTFTVSATAAGSPGDVLSYAWTVPAGWTLNGGQGTAVLNVTAPNTYQASGSIALTVSNGNGGSVNGQITVTTTSDPLPTINSVTATPNPVSVGATQTLSVSASSPSGDALTYAWAVPTGWTILSGQGTTMLTVSAPQSYGTSGDVTVTVSNPSGGAVNAVAPVNTGNDVVASIEMAPTAAGTYLIGSTGPAGFTLYGDTEQMFTATAYDANHVAILGPGAPTITATGTSGLALTSPAPSSPNVWGITNSAFNTLEYVTLTATPASGPAVTATVPVLTRHLVYYASSQTTDVLSTYYDEGATPVQTLAVPGGHTSAGLAVSDSGTIVVPQFASGFWEIRVISGNQNVAITSGIGGPNNVCTDHFGNIYVTDDTGGSGFGQVEEYSATGATTPTATYTTNMNFPLACAVDINNGLYVLNSSDSSIVHFPYGSTTPDDRWVISGGIQSAAAGIAVDRVGTVYVGMRDLNASPVAPRVQVYPKGSHTMAFSLNTHSGDSIDTPSGLSVDVAGNLWVGTYCNGTCGKVQIFKAPITSSSTPTDLPYTGLNTLIGGVVAPHQ